MVVLEFLETLAANPLNWVFLCVDIWLVRELLAPLPAPPKPNHSEPILLRNFTLKELRVFDGTTPQSPLLVGVNGKVYDVSRGRGFYGPGSAYGNFAGRDASRALAKHSFDETMFKDEPDLLGDLTKSEWEALHGWQGHFETKYDHKEALKTRRMKDEGQEHALVIGGAGCVGRCLVSYLLEKGQRVSVFDLVPYHPTQPGNSLVTSFTGSILDTDKLCEAMEGVDTVHHLASAIDLSPKMSAKLRAINVQGTENVLACCEKQGVKRLVYTSSVEVFFDGTGYLGDVEVDDLDYPEESKHLVGYTTSKILAEKEIMKFCETHRSEGDLACCMLRPVHIYGPDDTLLKEAADSVKVLAPVTWPMWNPPKISMINVRNVAHGHFMAAEGLKRGGINSINHAQGYVLAEGTSQNTLEYLITMAKEKNLKTPTIKVPTAFMMFLATVFHFFAALLSVIGVTFKSQLTPYTVKRISTNLIFPYTKATRDFGYQPIISFEEGRKEALEWFLSYKPPGTQGKKSH